MVILAEDLSSVKVIYTKYKVPCSLEQMDYIPVHIIIIISLKILFLFITLGHVVAQLVKHYATEWKVAGLIPDEIIGNFS
jgi:hypothetical protein